jgi:hypothetical protein
MSHRVFQWASGTVGKHAIAAVAKRDDLILAGLHVLGPDKVGRDAGEIAGAGTLGVTATGTIEAVIDSNADVVLHAPLASLVYGDNPDEDIDTICTLLAAGKNVITVVGYLYPKVHGGALMTRLETACAQGNTTFHSTGLNPGWMGDLVPLTMSALSRDIQRIVVQEISNFRYYPSPEIMFGSMGFGQSLDDFETNGARRRAWLNGLFRESIQLVADGIGLGLDDIDEQMTVALAPSDLDTASGTVRKGTVAGQRWEWAGVKDGNQRIIHETVWRMHDAVAPEWPTGNHSITIEGTPRMFLEFQGNWIGDGLLGTAMHAVNAIPYVCGAEPGVKTFLELPWIMGKV